MEYNIDLPFKDKLTEEENIIIDDFLDKIYLENEKNYVILNNLSNQLISFISFGKYRFNDFLKYSFIRDLLSNIKSDNRQINDDIDRDFALVFEFCIRFILKLALENKLKFDSIISFNVRINSLINDCYDKFKDLYIQLGKIMQSSISSLIRESQVIDSLENSINISYLDSTIDYLEFDGILYKDLDNNDKALCIISDFFLTSKGKYSINDFMMLKSMMSKVDLDPNSKVSLDSFYRRILSNKKILDKLFESIDRNKLNFIFDFSIPLISNIRKIDLLYTNDKYIVDTISNMSNRSLEDVQFELFSNYCKNELNIDLSKENTYFDLSVSIINELKNIDLFEVRDETKNSFVIGNSNLGIMYEELGDSYFKLGDLDRSFNNYNLAVENGLENKDIYYKICALIFYNISEKNKKMILKLPYVEEENINVYSINPKDYYSTNNISEKCKLFLTKNIKSKMYNARKIATKGFMNSLFGRNFKNYNNDAIFSLTLDYVYDDKLYIYMFEKIEEVKLNNFVIDRENIDNYIDKFLKFSDNSFDSTLDSGIIYYFLEDYELALEFFEKSIKIDNERTEGFINKALVLNTIDKVKNRHLVEEALNRAIGLESQLSKTFKNQRKVFGKDLNKVLYYETSFKHFLFEIGV